jgi:hypothetical protein
MGRKTNRAYRAYLLRCWQEGETLGSEGHRWRFSVEEVLHKRRQRGFNGLEALFVFLRTELADEDMSSADS